jgi:hypothetical protein
LTRYAVVVTGFPVACFRIEIPGIHSRIRKYSFDNDQTIIKLMKKQCQVTLKQLARKM